MSEMEVTRINLDGDLGVINAARVSYGRQKTELDDKDIKLLKFLNKEKHLKPFCHPQLCFELDSFQLAHFSKTEIAGLEWYNDPNNEGKYYIRSSLYLYEQYKDYFKQCCCLKKDDDLPHQQYDENWLLKQENLFKASRLPYLQFRIIVPLMVEAQLATSQVGMTKTQLSFRYTTRKPKFWEPKKDENGRLLWRKKSDTNKQGSNPNEFVEEKELEVNVLQYRRNFKEKCIDMFYSVAFFLFRVDVSPTKVRFNYNLILSMIEDWYKLNIEN
jgi:hypothetical protein